MLAGLVSINASCNDVEPWAALVIGIVATFFYSISCKIYEKLHIDDPVDAS